MAPNNQGIHRWTAILIIGVKMVDTPVVRRGWGNDDCGQPHASLPMHSLLPHQEGQQDAVSRTAAGIKGVTYCL